MIFPAVIIGTPLLVAILVLLVRRFEPSIALAGATGSFVMSVLLLAQWNTDLPRAFTLPGLPEHPLLINVDSIAVLLAVTVATVNVMVILYSLGYMRDEQDQGRFYAGMGLFTGAMQLLVFAGDWILFLAAWEIMGLASYLLIAYWFSKSETGPAASRAFLMTRSTDLGLYLGIVVLVTATGTTRIVDSLGVTGLTGTLAGVALIVAATGKSAQVPFHGWLQDAMVGPTPVSALLHSATLVIAGVVLLIRSLPLLSPELLFLLGLVGGVTALVAGLMALAQRDLKRMLAASTSSQIGFMFLTLATGSIVAALFHLIANAAIKSSLFLGSGIFQHSRRSTAFDALGGIGAKHRFTFVAVVIAGLALAGVPPLSGFWSKEAVLSAILHEGGFQLQIALVAGATLLTGMYVSRAMRLLWRNGEENQDSAVAGMSWMRYGLAGLTTLSIILGGAGTSIGRYIGGEMPFSISSLIIGLILTIAGLVLGWIRPASFWLGAFTTPAERGFRIAGGYVGLIVHPAQNLAQYCERVDSAIHSGVLTVGRGVASWAGHARRIDETLHGIVRTLGSRSTTTARRSAMIDDIGIVGLIQSLVEGVRDLATRARKLQTGLVHRELLLAAGGTLLLIVVMFLN